jgi:hypothetical protein
MHLTPTYDRNSTPVFIINFESGDKLSEVLEKAKFNCFCTGRNSQGTWGKKTFLVTKETNLKELYNNLLNI